MGNCINEKPVPARRGGPIPLIYREETQIKQRQLEKIGKERIHCGFHGWIGALASQDIMGNSAYGSAVLISNDLILTVAHNVYDIAHKCEYSNFKFYLAPCGLVGEYLEVEPKAWRFPKEFKTSQAKVRYIYDYAIMKLSRPLSLPKEPLPLQLMCGCRRKKLQQKAELSIYGYPRYKSNYEVRKSKIELYQYGLTRNNVFHRILQDNSCIQYYISTLPGHSGSPIIHQGKIMGLHFGGGIEEQQSYNKGRLITNDVMDELIKWEKEIGGSPFIINPQSICKHIPKKTRYNIEERFRNLNRQKEIASTLSQTHQSQTLEMNQCNLREISMESHRNLKELSLQMNRLESIDLSKNKALTKLNLGSNQFTTIDLKYNTLLIHLFMSSNKLKIIDLSANKGLKRLDLSGNQLQEISLINNRNIANLSLYENTLKFIKFCYLNKIELEIQNQHSQQCKVDIIYLKRDYEMCLTKMVIQSQRYSNPNNFNAYPNKYNCEYIFDMFLGV